MFGHFGRHDDPVAGHRIIKEIQLHWLAEATWEERQETALHNQGGLVWLTSRMMGAGIIGRGALAKAQEQELAREGLVHRDRTNGRPNDGTKAVEGAAGTRCRRRVNTSQRPWRQAKVAARIIRIGDRVVRWIVPVAIAEATMREAAMVLAGWLWPRGPA